MPFDRIFLDELSARNDIVEIVSQYVQLKKSGANYSVSYTHLDVYKRQQESMAFIAAYEGEIPGASRIECGNYLLHDLAGAKQLAASMIPVLEGWKEENLIYEK